MSHSLKEAVLPCAHDHRPLVHAHDEHHRGEDDRHSHKFDMHRPQQRRALFWCVALTTTMMIIEFIAGWFTGSLMLRYISATLSTCFLMPLHWV